MLDIVLDVAGTGCKTSWLHMNVRSNLLINYLSNLISFIAPSHLLSRPWSHINIPLRPSKTLSYLRSVKPNTSLMIALLCFNILYLWYIYIYIYLCIYINIHNIYIYIYIYIYEYFIFYTYIPIFLVPSFSS